MTLLLMHGTDKKAHVSCLRRPENQAGGEVFERPRKSPATFSRTLFVRESGNLSKENSSHQTSTDAHMIQPNQTIHGSHENDRLHE